MSESQWVQHKSGQGEKWRVIGDLPQFDFFVARSQGRTTVYRLPRSEYSITPPPEVWRDVTKDCTVDELGRIFHKAGPELYWDVTYCVSYHSDTSDLQYRQYRIRKKMIPSAKSKLNPFGLDEAVLIVEQKET